MVPKQWHFHCRFDGAIADGKQIRRNNTWSSNSIYSQSPMSGSRRLCSKIAKCNSVHIMGTRVNNTSQARRSPKCVIMLKFLRIQDQPNATPNSWETVYFHMTRLYIQSQIFIFPFTSMNNCLVKYKKIYLKKLLRPFMVITAPDLDGQDVHVRRKMATNQRLKRWTKTWDNYRKWSMHSINVTFIDVNSTW